MISKDLPSVFVTIFVNAIIIGTLRRRHADWGFAGSRAGYDGL